jgi:hypothetical protein
VYVNAINEPALDDTPGEDPTSAPAIAATEDSQECDISTPALGYLGDPTAFPKYAPFAGDPFEGIAPVAPGPQFAAPQEATLNTTLRWGFTQPPPEGASRFKWGGWGWRHIVAKHGWATADAQATQSTLLQGTDYTNDEGRNVYEAPGSAAYYQNGTWCIRVVVIDPNPQAGDTYLGQPAPAPGIWTSYGERTSFPLK